MKTMKRAAAVLAGALLSSMLFATNAFGASYTVTSGDSLYTIGQLFHVTASTIQADNKLSSSMIRPGQVLYIRSRSYTVKSGDTLYLIAKKFGITVNTLMRANNKWDTLLWPGQVLDIPNAVTTSPASSISYTQAEADLLARLVTAEAESEPYQAQVAVAAVVINRVRSDQFPDTISSVVYQKSDGYYQFTPVENGWISKPTTQTARNAVLDALKGSDPSNGALYYFDDSTTNKWLWSKPLLARIGHMVFVY